MMLRITTILLAIAALALTGGCRDREITAYRAPKDPVTAAPPAAAAQMPPGATLPDGHPPIGGAEPASAPGAMTGAVPTAEGSALLWTAPANWTAKDRGSMRKGSYAIAGDAGAVADLAITAFPGDTGGLFANVNRWRGQVGLPPIAESEISTSIEHVDAGIFHIELVDITGSPGGVPTTLLGAIVPHNGQTWFFKLMGPQTLVAREKPAFREFLNTIKPR